MADAYDHYAGLFLHSNAAFLCERAHAEQRTPETLEALASCYLRQGAAGRAHGVLRGHATTPRARYLLAIACQKLDKHDEAEAALLPDRSARAAGPRRSRALLTGADSPVPHGAAGLYVLGVICERTHRRDAAVDYYRLALERDALLWVAFDALCRLGAAVDAEASFRDAAPHALRDLVSNAPPSAPPSASSTASAFAGTPGGPLFATPASVDDENAPPRRSSRARATPRPADSPASADASAARPKALSFASATPSVADELTSTDKPRAKVARRQSRGGGADLADRLLPVLRKLGAARDCLARTRGAEALRHLHGVPARHFETGWVQHAVGRVHFEAADYDAAVNAFRAMQRHAPDRLEGLELLSTALWHLKDEVELCYLARRCVDADPRAPESWCAAGNCLSLQKEHDGAIRCFHRAIAVAPRFAYAYTLCGHEYVANEDFEKAIAMYRHAMRLDERHYNAWYGLGAIYYRQEKYELAEYHFERALVHNPTSSVLHCYLGMTLHANKKCHDALRHLKRAAAMEPKNPQARFQCANVLISMDRYDEALGELRAVSDRAPREASVHFLMGKVCKKLGRLDDAMMHFTFALDLEPKDNNLIKSAIDRLEEPDISEDEKF